jgi:hypothetical protein
VSLIAPRLYKAAGIVVSAPLALVMKDVPVSEQRAPVGVKSRQLVKRQIVDKHGCRIRRIVRASAQIDDLGPGHRLFQANGAGGVGIRTHQAAIPCAGADCNVESRVLAHMLRYCQRGFAADRTVDTVMCCGD